MGQDIVARDEVELHSSRVVLEGQQALPHDGVFLLTRKQSKDGIMACLARPWKHLFRLYQLGDWGTLRTEQSQGVKSSLCPSYLQKLDHIHRPL